jgi:myo-inositol 2-dehydrogenase / D-chiro-inositol 1-dehydrogenase
VNPSPLSVGLIGCGYAAETHLAALRALPDARVVAIADIDESARRAIAARDVTLQTFADYRALLEHPGIDVVAILTPPFLHLEMAGAALDAGKHVLVEKPITPDLDEADRLVEIARCSTKKVIVGYHLRFHRQLQEARRHVREGALGEVAFVRGVASSNYQFGRRFPEYRRRRDLGGGVLFELAVHHFDLWRYMLGEEVAEIVATSHAKNGEDATATVTARMASGILVTSVFSEYAAEQHEIEIYGDRGRVRASIYRFDGFDLIPAGVFEGHLVRRLRRFVEALGAAAPAVRASRQGGVFLASFRSLWQHFVEAIRHDTAVAPDLEDGRRSLQVALAAVRSADSGRVVRVNDAPRRVAVHLPT